MNNDVLFKLIKDGKYKEFEKILENNNNIDLNVRDSLDNYLIMYTVIQNNYSTIKKLLDRGCRIDIVDNEGRTLLFYAVRYGYHKVLKLILSYDKDSVGISIIDLKDRYGMIPLHYAAIFKDSEAVKILLEYGSNPNTFDKNGNNALHHAIYNQGIEVCNELLKTNINVNARALTTGENALHLAINFNMIQVAKKLIELDIDVNAKDFNHEFTALHYTVTVNNIKVFKLLLETDVNINQQDHLGYTMFHYICAMNQELFFDVLMQSDKINKLNVNIYNYENRTAIMMYLNDNNNKFNEKHLEYLIQNSNLNIQNFQGYSALHLTVKKQLWKKYKHILATKKLNIFLQSTDKIRPVDLVDKADTDDFMSLVIDSYLYVLRNYKDEVWSEDWENTCKTVKSSMSDLECKKLIKKQLDTLITSYPVKSSCKKIYLTKDEKCKDVNICTFTGAVLDVLFGLIHLLKTNNNCCTPVSTVSTVNVQFEIRWEKDVLKMNDNFIETFKMCKKRFIIVPLGIELDQGSHANYIIYDSLLNEFERFEPYGSHGPYQFNYNSNILDFNLKKLFLNVYPDAKYFKPSDFLPKIAFQFFETVEAKTSKIGDPSGFCALWSIWYTDQRLNYPDVNRRSLVKKLIKQIRLQDISYKNLIRNYSVNITNIRDKVFEKVNITINDWINDSYKEEDLKLLNSEIDKILLKYNNNGRNHNCYNKK